MELALLKPDFRIEGGLERVLRRVVRELEARGHVITWLTADARAVPRAPFQVGVPETSCPGYRDFLRYLGLVEEFQGLDTSYFDAVISTQSPSFAVSHPRHLSLFSHHERSFYDLDDVYIASGRADRAVQDVVRPLIREVDQQHLERVSYFLAASPTVKERLRVFNGLTANVGIYHAGTGIDEALVATTTTGWHHVLCVSRHEFTKRTELFVHAMKYLHPLGGHSVGSGGLLAHVQALDQRISAPGTDLDAIDDRGLWLNPGPVSSPGALEAGNSSNITFHGQVPDQILARLYADALCVVAPAYLEDYGLTAIEAMAWGKPLIVCADGGGLVGLVEDGITGLVVEPTGAAIAAAVGRLAADRTLAREMGNRGREVARRFTWERAIDEITEALGRVAG